MFRKYASLQLTVAKFEKMEAIKVSSMQQNARGAFDYAMEIKRLERWQ